MANKETIKLESLSEMNIYQLGSLRQQLEQEIEILGRSVEQLITLQNRFKQSEICIFKQSQTEENSEILVPLTSSLYVQGTIKDKKKFLIDIGTGYYVEKELEGALDYFSRKIKFLAAEIEKLTKLTQAKINFRDSVLEEFQFKTQQQVASN
ncbi:hypothetical protein RND71_044043 [Anisodus tanguticus]|uniref:Prefoldin subunit 5 n=1 Tax=Anisodus tanguticus TaxID=243964 RepID=A0AAE1QSC1_9SOLA|nr:hypothetical protein RND71_044043 [Anisodus tanguticus]